MMMLWAPTTLLSVSIWTFSMDNLSYWQKQNQQPLFPDIDIEQPEQKQFAGHLLNIGGNSSAFDRVTASRFGYRAMEMLADGISDRVVGLKAGKVVDYDITAALEMNKPIDEEMYRIARILSI